MNKYLSDKGRIAFGGAAVAGDRGGYSFGGLSEAESERLLKRAFELGIRIFDSAPIYGFGESERRIGKAFKECREEVFITTKSGVSWDSSLRVNLSNQPELAQTMLDQSLKDLGASYIDLYMIHWPDPKVDIRRPMEVLVRAKARGDIRHIGLCNTTTEDLSKACEIERIEVVQSQLNPFCIENASLLPVLREQNIAFQSWGTLDKGILTGTVGRQREMAKDYPQGDARARAPWWKREEVLQKIECVEKIRPTLEQHNCSSLAWALAHNLVGCGIDQVIIGASSEQQLQEVVSAMEHLPSQKVLDEIQTHWEKIWPTQ